MATIGAFTSVDKGISGSRATRSRARVVFERFPPIKSAPVMDRTFVVLDVTRGRGELGGAYRHGRRG